MSASLQGDTVGAGASVTRSLPDGRGTGFQLEADSGQRDRLRLDVSAQNDVARFDIGVDRAASSVRYRGSASGGFVFMPGQVAAVRDIDSSFALVEVPAHAGVPVYRDNHLVATTDERGIAIVHGLRPYETNRLRIDPNELPIDIVIDEDEVEARPVPHGAVHVRFDVTSEGGATVRLIRSTGDPVPAGAALRYAGREAVVGMNGTAYLPSAQGRFVLEAMWPGHLCRAEIAVPSPAPLPDLGIVRCADTL